MLDGPAFIEGKNPLRDASAETWDRLVQAVGPPSMLVVIGSWLGPALRERIDAEDLWQETLLEAWTARDGFSWQGVRAFRSWLLEIAQHRVTRAAASAATARRGGRNRITSLDATADGETSHYAGPVSATTPSQVARDREAARAMERALDAMPEDLRGVVRLRLFEDLKIEEVAERLSLGVSAVRHRLRRGLALYRQRLAASLGEFG